MIPLTVLLAESSPENCGDMTPNTISLLHHLVLVTVYIIYLIFISLLWLFSFLNLHHEFIRFW